MIRLLVILFFFIVFDLYSQSTIWGYPLGASPGGAQPNGVVIDNDNNTISTGWFSGTVDFDPGPGNFSLTSTGTGGSDIFIQKVDVNGGLIWAKNIGGSSNFSGIANSIDVDKNNNIYITGWFDGTLDFDPNAGTFNVTSTTTHDIFILKLDMDGALVWAYTFGGGSQGNDIRVDSTGYIYLTGELGGIVDFDLGGGVANLTAIGPIDLFATKLDTNAGYIWAKNIGVPGPGTLPYWTSGNSIAYDQNDNAYVTGYFGFGVLDSDPGPGVKLDTNQGDKDIILLKLDVNGDFVWSQAFGSANEDRGLNVDVFQSGDVLFSGWFMDKVDFDYGAGIDTISSAGSYDGFVLKLNANGSYDWVRQITGTLPVSANFVNIVEPNSILVSGELMGTADLDPGTGTYFHSSNGVTDCFVSRWDFSGQYVWGESFGGTGVEFLNDVSVSSVNSFSVVGAFTDSMDINPFGASNMIYSKNSMDGFAIRIDGQTSIKEDFMLDGALLFPNPSNGAFNIESVGEMNSIIIYNLLGEVVFQNNASSKFTTIQIDLNDGLYLVRVLSDKGEFTRRVIIQNEH